MYGKFQTVPRQFKKINAYFVLTPGTEDQKRNKHPGIMRHFFSAYMIYIYILVYVIIVAYLCIIATETHIIELLWG